MILVIGAIGNVGSKVVSGILEWYADVIIALFRLYSTNFASKVTNVVLEVAKQSPRTFEQFARDYVQAFKR